MQILYNRKYFYKFVHLSNVSIMVSTIYASGLLMFLSDVDIIRQMKNLSGNRHIQ